jgi:hypothetical protein
MKNILIPVALLFTAIAHGQYYYNDIIGTAEIVARQKVYNANKVQLVSGVNFDDLRGYKTDDIKEFQQVKDNGRTLVVATTSKLEDGKTVVFETSYVIYRFDEQGRLSTLTDSAGSVTSVASYIYDPKGNLTLISNKTKDSQTGFEDVELHQWYYDANNKPYRLYRILAGTKDTTDVGFKHDANGNMIEEQIYRKGGFPAGDPLYYYYDDDNRLSDIVRFYATANRLLPDFQFEYDNANRVLQRTATTSAMRYTKNRPSLRLRYLIWRYTYDAKGLRIRETLYGKDKVKISHIEYDYSFGQ